MENTPGTLSFKDIYYSYPGIKADALNGINLTLLAGEKVALIGRNGGGKSTLMLIANGILRSSRGQLSLDGQPIQYEKQELMKLRRRVGVVFQNPEDQLFSASVMQDISFGPLNLGMSAEAARERVLETAAFCGLSDLMDRPTHALSGGEKTRAALAGVLAIEPVFLFADELTNSLDPWMKTQILGILDKWVERGRTVVLATHDWRLVREWAQRVIWLDKGLIYRQGSVDEVFRGQVLPVEMDN